jgi:hypothetical protein
MRKRLDRNWHPQARALLPQGALVYGDANARRGCSPSDFDKEDSPRIHRAMNHDFSLLGRADRSVQWPTKPAERDLFVHGC